MTRIVLFLLLASAACSSRGPRFAQMDAEALLQYGLEKKAAHKWTDATRALEQFIFQFPTHERYQEARYRLAEVYFDKHEYLTAASEYGRLANDFPTGEWVEEARSAVCESYYRLSPKPPLDQEYTRTAIDQCQIVLTFFPESEGAARAQEVLTEMRDRLAEKVYMNGEHYYKRNMFDSGLIYFTDLLEEYPMTPSAPKALMRMVNTYERLGYTIEATEARERLLRDYPESAEAQRIKSDTAKT